MFERHPIVAAAVATALQIVMNTFMNSYSFFKHRHYLAICYVINSKNKGWRHFVDNGVSWTLFFKMGDFSWTLLVTSSGQF